MRLQSPKGSGDQTATLSVVLPYAPLPQSFVYSSESESSDIETITACAKTGLWGLWYVNGDTENEFLRFKHRTLEGAAVTFLLGITNAIGATYFNGNPVMYAVTICTGCVGVMVGLLELLFHCAYRGATFTTKIAEFRHALHVVSALVAIFGILLGMGFHSVECDPKYLYSNEDRLFGQTRCRRIVTGDIGIQLVLFCMLRLNISVHVAVTILFWLTILLFVVEAVPLFRDRLPIAILPEEIVARLVLSFLGAIISNFVAVWRHRFFQRSFETTVEVHYRMQAMRSRMARLDVLLSTMVPDSALERMMNKERVFDSTPHATVLFSDMVHFTRWSSFRTPTQVVAMLAVVVRSFDILAAEMEVGKVKTIGDCYWAVTGIPEAMEKHAEVMIRFGLEMLVLIGAEARSHTEWDDLDDEEQEGERRCIQWRTGIHSGPVQAGVLGSQQISYEIFGETSAMANQVEARGLPDRVTVSEATKQLVSSNDEFLFSPLEHFEVQSSDLPSSPLTVDETQEVPETKSAFASSLFVVRAREDRRRAIMEVSVESPRSISDDPARLQRRRYVEEYLVRGTDDSSSAQVSSESAPPRRFCFILLGFADPQLEAEYQQFVLVELIDLRVFSSMLNLVVFTVILILILVDARFTQFSVPCLVLHSLSMLFFVIGFVLACYRQQEIRTLRSRGQNFGLTFNDVVGYLILCAGYLCWIAAALIGPDAVLTNNFVYTGSICLFLCSLPNGQLSALFCWLAAVPVAFATTLCFPFNPIANITIYLFGWAVMFLHEIRLRAQFVETKMVTHFASQQATTLQAQDALLRSMLPNFVIEPLLLWIDAEFHPSKAVAQKYDEVSVAFIFLQPKQQKHDLLRSQSPDEQGNHISKAVPSDNFVWLFAGHQEVDAILGQTEVIDKVKTVGDLVIVAGSFRGHSSQDAALVLLSTMLQLHRDVGTVTIGLHFGPVMGIVLGFSRLAFDIFGDTVNTCSRVATSTIGEYKITASTDFIAKTGPQQPNVDFGHVCEIKAKGKGEICVREIRSAEK